jgi:1,4-alpha-glucan branching enzyme
MNKGNNDSVIFRGVSLHKMIRLITSSLAGDGYLNFMGNEFGHPEWIDFPREGNGWSYHYCRRQWNLVDNPDLLYMGLNDFDKAMISLLKKEKILTKNAELLLIHEDDKILSYKKGEDLFVFNFHPYKSFEGYAIPAESGEYKVILSTDDSEFGGNNRIDKEYVYKTEEINGRECIKLYIPSRTGFVLKKL